MFEFLGCLDRYVTEVLQYVLGGIETLPHETLVAARQFLAFAVGESARAEPGSLRLLSALSRSTAHRESHAQMGRFRNGDDAPLFLEKR